MNHQNETCDGCRWHDARTHDCLQLLGRLACPLCRELWNAADGFRCPSCDRKPAIIELSDTADGRPCHCPGFEQSTPDPLPGQLSLFE